MLLKKDQNPDDYYLDSALRGERAGLEYMVNAYRDMAYTIAIRIVANVEDAEEVVQDSFLKAFKYLDRFKRASKRAWADYEEYGEFISDEDNGLKRLAEADRKKYITLAISKLKEQDQLIITLHYIADKSIAEITEIMEMKSSAIKMRLLRSREKLERELVRLLNNEINEL